MKKLKLGAGELLIREQMKNLLGGEDENTGTIGLCPSGAMPTGCACLYESPTKCISNICNYKGHIFGRCA